MDEQETGLGRRIREIRADAGLSQAELGRLLGLKEGAVSRYERGTAEPNVNGLVKIAAIGEVSIDWLITGGGKAKTAHKDLTTEDLFAEIATRPELLQKIQSYAREQVREEFSRYGPDRKAEEQHLIDAYNQASQEIKQAALTMLENSAKQSRKTEGGGSDSQAGNCA